MQPMLFRHFLGDRKLRCFCLSFFVLLTFLFSKDSAAQEKSPTIASSASRNAVIHFVSVPSPEVGRRFVIEGVAKNVGSFPWESKGSNACHLTGITPFGDTKDHQIKLSPALIASNENASFEFELVAPRTPGTYRVSCQMSCAGEKFGAIVEAPILVQPTFERPLRVDVNNDGRADLVNVSLLKTGLRVHTLLSTEAGGWTEVQDEPWPGFRYQQAGWKISDVNGDGKADLVNMFYRAPGLRVHALISDAKGAWIRASHDLWPTYLENDMENWKVADLNGDGKTDWVDVYRFDSDLRVHSLISQGDGTWVMAQADPLKSYPYRDAENWKVSEIDGDGKEDLVDVLHNGRDLRVQVLLSQGNGSWTINYQDVWPAYEHKDATTWKVAELNGDKRRDLINVVTLPSALRIDFLISQSDGTWSRHRQEIEGSGNSGSSFVIWKVADVGDDSRNEIVCFYQQSPGVMIKVFRIATDGKWELHAQRTWTTSTASDVLNWKISDINGDGKDDLVELNCVESGLGMMTLISTSGGQWLKKPQTTVSSCVIADFWNWKFAE